MEQSRFGVVSWYRWASPSPQDSQSDSADLERYSWGTSTLLLWSLKGLFLNLVMAPPSKLNIFGYMLSVKISSLCSARRKKCRGEHRSQCQKVLPCLSCDWGRRLFSMRKGFATVWSSVQNRFISTPDSQCRIVSSHLVLFNNIFLACRSIRGKYLWSRE